MAVFVTLIWLVLTYTGFSTHFDRYKQFKEFQKRILVATDLFGRGIDIEREACLKKRRLIVCFTVTSHNSEVNIVINYDMPDESDSYLRLGNCLLLRRRAGSPAQDEPDILDKICTSHLRKRAACKSLSYFKDTACMTSQKGGF